MSSNVNKIFLTGEIQDIKMQETFCAFTLHQPVYLKTGNSQEGNESFREISHYYRVVVYRQFALEDLRKIEAANRSSDHKMPVLLIGYISPVLPNGQVSGKEFGETEYSEVIVAQDLILLEPLPDMSKEKFRQQLLSFNNYVLLGNTGAKPEVRETKDGDKTIVYFSVATNMPYRHNGQRMESKTWHRVSVIAPKESNGVKANSLSRLSEVVQNYVGRGCKVLIMGNAQSRKWIGKDTSGSWDGKRTEGKETQGIQMVLQNNAATLSIQDRGRDANNNRGGQYNNYQSNDHSYEYDADFGNRDMNKPGSHSRNNYRENNDSYGREHRPRGDGRRNFRQDQYTSDGQNDDSIPF